MTWPIGVYLGPPGIISNPQDLEAMLKSREEARLLREEKERAEQAKKEAGDDDG